MRFQHLFLILAYLFISCSPNNKEKDSQFTLDETLLNIYVDKNSDELIKWAANDLSEDLEQILGKKIIVSYNDEINPDTKGIYIGKFNDSLIKNLPANGAHKLQDKWENFAIKKYNENLYIIGSDIRGTVYGIFELAERIGISPWKWWADVTPLKSKSLILELGPNGIEEAPSVQYRGIFLNDEDWGLQPWAANTFEPETKDIGPKTYKKIFQLLLRLKANTIWPAMHSSTKAFFTISGNKEMAEKYHIFIGTSHAEPMLRNNVGEWDGHAYGEFNYFTNSNKVKQYWQERITETKGGDYIYTLGMRGIHDSGMEGTASQEERVKILDTIIRDQREILTKTLNRPIESIPQILVPYKEVLELYNGGLKVYDDVTLMWTDDNYGYIRRLSNKQEQSQKGDSGVYYHLSYWGQPHDHLWLSTTQPGLIWYEMSKAYQNGARKIWIANVGDIKPAEYNIEFFMDMAWDINSISETSIKAHLMNWSKREFGAKEASGIANLFEEYYHLAFLRKPEYMGWSAVEPITSINITEFTTNNGNELQRRIDSYQNLWNMMEQIQPKISKERQDAYFQLVEYPVKCAALMNFKFLYAQQAFLSSNKNQNQLLYKKSQKAFEDIKTLTTKYNSINNGKWHGMMSMKPRNLPVFEIPNYKLSEVHSIETEFNNKNLSLSPIFIQASEFTKSVNVDNFEWKIINGLGYSNSSVTLFPLDNRKFGVEAPCLEYEFNTEKAGNFQIEIRCLPTHSNNFDQKIWIEIDGKRFKPSSLNTKGRSDAWKKNVLRNYVSTTYTIDIDKKGKHLLKFFVNQTGIVLDQIAITPDGYGSYYEIVK
ncbi:MAG TPA: glycosyl hydrolase 115 family protein [Flavobacteriaceae bacterium]|nr:glycosyl hydrolase 115 family protein [Flavobacteriaceae bacterium]